MNIYFRLDVSEELGTGHLMRCLTLAEELDNRGAEVTFLCREIAAYYKTLISNKKCRLIALSGPFSEEQDAEEVVHILKSDPKPIDWLIVDHYKLNELWELRLKPLVNKIAVIDDLDRAHACNLLLDQNLSALTKGKYSRLESNSRKLFGPSYALLRQEFVEFREKIKQREGNVHHLLVCFGGTDPTNETVKCLRALQDQAFHHMTIDVVIGGANRHTAIIDDFCKRNTHFTLHVQTNKMSELMGESDLAICSVGTLTWERLCMGLSAITIAVADNQRDNARSTQELGIDSYLGDSSAIEAEDILTALKKRSMQVDFNREASKRAFNLVDGKGVLRVADQLIGPREE